MPANTSPQTIPTSQRYTTTNMAKPLVTVDLPALDDLRHIQQVIGKVSLISADIEEFRGIPYACVPGRWQHSHIRKRLPQDRFEALSNGPKCPQAPEPNNSSIYQIELEFPPVKEDEFECLNLFVVRPSRAALKRNGLDSDVSLPTLVWIHGGAFGFGSGTDPMWDPSQLVLESLRIGKPCIAVAINYRLGVFGFGGCTQMLEKQTSGDVRGLNFGFRDQKVALTWVSLNIEAFGGDPNQITIGGQSAGGCSVHVHALEAKYSSEVPLFRAVAIQSGSVGCLGPMSLEKGDALWQRFSQQAGVTATDPDVILNTMKQKTADELLQVAKQLGLTGWPIFNDKMSLSFAEGLRPLAINLGHVHDRPARETEVKEHEIAILIGQVEDEGVIWDEYINQLASYEHLKNSMHSLIPSATTIRKLQEIYSISPTSSVTYLRNRVRTLLTDINFGYPLHLAAQTFGNNRPDYSEMPTSYHKTKVEVYRMLFGNPFEGIQKGVAHHCVELIYQFNVSPESFTEVDKIEQGFPVKNDTLRRQIQQMWINFITEQQTGVSGLSGTGKVMLFNKDRSSAVVDKPEHPFFQAESRRFELLQNFSHDLGSFTASFVGGS